MDFRQEVTIGHLLADVTTADGVGGKVNPPLRPRADVEKLGGRTTLGFLETREGAR